ncbi:hypothetical protein ACGS9J_22910, partial [Serratia quinivorans]
MSDQASSKRISELSPAGPRLNDTDIFPSSYTKGNGTFVTHGATLQGLRHLLGFEHAVYTTDEGLSQTFDTQIFYVYTDVTRFFVSEYANVGGKAEATGNVYSTRFLIDTVFKNSGAVQSSPDAILDVVTANGVRPFVIREEDGATLFEMVAKLVTGNDGLK